MELSLLLLKTYWKVIVGFILGILIAAFIGHWFYDARVQKLKGQRIAAIAEVRAEAIKERTDLVNKIQLQQTQTEELNRENIAKVADLQRRVDDAKRLYKGSSACVGVTPRSTATTGGSDAGNVPGRYVQQGNGIDASDLIDYFATAEKIRQSQDTCRRQMDTIYAQ